MEPSISRPDSPGVQWAISCVVASQFVPIVNIAVAVISLIYMTINATKDFYFHNFNLSNFNEMLSNPIGNGYKRVEVRVSSGGGSSGNTVYEFTSPSAQYPLLVEKYQWPYTRKPRAAQWVYGLPTTVKVLDKDNKLVSEKINNYTAPVITPIANANNINCKCASRTQYSIKSDDWEALSGYIPIPTSSAPQSGEAPIGYYYYTGRMDLASTTEKTYANGMLAHSVTTDERY